MRSRSKIRVFHLTTQNILLDHVEGVLETKTSSRRVLAKFLRGGGQPRRMRGGALSGLPQYRRAEPLDGCAQGIALNALHHIVKLARSVTFERCRPCGALE